MNEVFIIFSVHLTLLSFGVVEIIYLNLHVDLKLYLLDFVHAPTLLPFGHFNQFNSTGSGVKQGIKSFIYTAIVWSVMCGSMK